MVTAGPRVNGILLVRLLVGGKLDVTADVLGWEDVELIPTYPKLSFTRTKLPWDCHIRIRFT